VDFKRLVEKPLSEPVASDPISRVATLEKENTRLSTIAAILMTDVVKLSLAIAHADPMVGTGFSRSAIRKLQDR